MPSLSCRTVLTQILTLLALTQFECFAKMVEKHVDVAYHLKCMEPMIRIAAMTQTAMTTTRLTDNAAVNTSTTHYTLHSHTGSPADMQPTSLSVVSYSMLQNSPKHTTHSMHTGSALSVALLSGCCKKK